jgi:hypothetical protein
MTKSGVAFRASHAEAGNFQLLHSFKYRDVTAGSALKFTVFKADILQAIRACE